MSDWRAWPSVVAGSAVLALGLVLLGAWMPARAAAVAWFALVIPGGALVPLLGLRDRVAELTLAIALSLALDLIVACGMLYAGVWNPTAGVVVLVAVSLAGAVLQVPGVIGRGRAVLSRGRATASLEPSVLVVRRNGSSAQLSLNDATAEQLGALRGVGPVTAQRIVAWRAAHGRFDSIEDVAHVPGVGPSLVAALRGRVRP